MKLFAKRTALPAAEQKERDAALYSAARLDAPSLLLELSTAPLGLSADEALERLEEHGGNVITSGAQNTALRRLREAVVNPFNVVLLGVALITLLTDVIYAAAPDFLTVVIILSLIAVSSAVAFIESQRSGAAAHRLSEMIENKADVIRDGEVREIPMDEVVPGDIVRLSAGDMIPADIRFLTAKDAFVAQAALTGESAPVEKFSELREPSRALTDLSNIGFMGTNIVSGSATGAVLATGNDTVIGRVAKSISGGRAKNSFVRGVDSVSRLLLRLMLVMVPVVFLINGLTKGNWGGALLFAVTMAVGLTPEMLPVIMTSTLARGAVSMSRHKVIVKTLGAIQAFGEMDVLCTDKTGTLTEDKIVLERYLNLHGEDDRRVLRHAYLNSHFQTGLKNLLDLAIINRAREYGLEDLTGQYTRLDEIPFDFARRRMSVVIEDKAAKRQLITKGAAEEIIAICSFAEIDGKVVPLDDDIRRHAMEIYGRHNRDGLRMIAVAQKNEVPGIEVFSVADERDMVLLGFVGFLDPPKKSAKAAIRALSDYGVRTVVLTGDSEGVAAKVCREVGVDISHMLTGRDVEAMDDRELGEAAATCNLFAKLSPAQKARVVAAFQAAGHTVGYMGDGINDAPPLHRADVAVSVDTAVDIAKETADIILLKKDLMVLEEGVIEGRRTFGNIVKYIKMASSGNFGNMISVIAASIALPFLPMLPVQILTQNLLCDFAQMGIPFDRVDGEYLRRPRRWDTRGIQSFMLYLGPLSSVFDILCFCVMGWTIGADSPAQQALFHCGWFVFGTVSQVLVIHMIRTGKIPFLHSRAAWPLLLSTLAVAAVALAVGFSGLSIGLDMAPLPLRYLPWLAALLLGYCLSTQLLKIVYVRRFHEWL